VRDIKAEVLICPYLGVRVKAGGSNRFLKLEKNPTNVHNIKHMMPSY